MPLNQKLLKSLREKRGFTQDQAAKLSGLKSRQHWNNIETGRFANISMSVLDAIAGALGVKASDLIVEANHKA